MNRDQLAALARAAVTLAIGGAILIVIARSLGWVTVAGIVVLAIGDAIWCATSTRWRLW